MAVVLIPISYDGASTPYARREDAEADVLIPISYDGASTTGFIMSSLVGSCKGFFYKSPGIMYNSAYRSFLSRDASQIRLHINNL